VCPSVKQPAGVC